MSEKENGRKNNDAVGKEIKRLWDGLPVVDAVVRTLIVLKPEDFLGAEKKNPNCCVFARALKRSLGCSKVVFLRSVAYIDMPDSGGEIKVYRYIMPPNMRALIEAFDKGDASVQNASFTLLPPTPGRTLESRIMAARRRRERRRAQLLGELSSADGPESNSKPVKSRGPHASPIIVDLSVRNGTGAVHFTSRKADKVS